MSTPDPTADVFDVIVIGGGPAGEVAAQYAIAGSSRTAAIIEQERLGGECSYWACMPSKALLVPIAAATTADDLQGVEPHVGVSPTELLARRDSWVDNYDDSSQVSWATDTGIAVIRGAGLVDGDRAVRVTSATQTRLLTARHAVVVATGSVPVIPDAYAAINPWTSRDATGVTTIPESIVVIGGGVVACESATWLSALGTHVTLVSRHGLLGSFDGWVGEQVADGLRAAGVDVRTYTHTGAVSRDEVFNDAGVGVPHGGPVTVEVSGGSPITAAEILVATGRRPAPIGADPDEHDWLYAVGDASGGPALTHWGKYQGRMVGAEIAARAEGKIVAEPLIHPPVPQVVFTDPQVASVGRTAESAGDGYRSVSTDLGAVAGFALQRDNAAGTAQLVIDDERDVIVGATFVGPGVGELLHAATIAIVAEVPLTRLRHAVAAYPTASEVWLNLVEEALTPPPSDSGGRPHVTVTGRATGSPRD